MYDIRSKWTQDRCLLPLLRFNRDIKFGLAVAWIPRKNKSPTRIQKYAHIASAKIFSRNLSLTAFMIHFIYMLTCSIASNAIQWCCTFLFLTAIFLYLMLALALLFSLAFSFATKCTANSRLSTRLPARLIRFAFSQLKSIVLTIKQKVSTIGKPQWGYWFSCLLFIH